MRELDLKAYKTESVPFEVFNYNVAELESNIGVLDKKFEVIVLDAAGKLDNNLPIETQEITNILMYVDCLFIPFVAGNHNINATIQYLKHFKQVQKKRQLQPRLFRPVVATPLEHIWEVFLLFLGLGIVVDIAIPLPISEPLHHRGHSIP